MSSILKRLDLKGSVLILTAKKEPFLERAARNIQDVTVKRIEGINLTDILSHRKLVLTPEVIKRIEEVFGG